MNMGSREAGRGVAPWTLREGGTGVLRGAGGEAGPGAALRDTDCGLEPASAWAGETEANGSESVPGAAGLELKNDMGDEGFLHLANLHIFHTTYNFT